MTTFPINKANVYTAVFICERACLLELKQEGQMAMYRSPEYQTSFESVGLSVSEEKFEIDFQDGGCGSHLGILTGIITATFTLQITPIPSNQVKSRRYFYQVSSHLPF